MHDTDHGITTEVTLQRLQKHLTLIQSNSEDLHVSFETVPFPKEPLWVSTKASYTLHNASRAVPMSMGAPMLPQRHCDGTAEIHALLWNSRSNTNKYRLNTRSEKITTEAKEVFY